MRIRGQRTILKAVGWAGARLRPGPVILGYHSIATAASDPQNLFVSEEHFSEQLEVLSRVVTPLSLQQLGEGMTADGVSRRSVAVTFDDGYRDVYETALPLLEKYGIPVTVFVISGMIGSRYWWTEIQHLVETAGELPQSIKISVSGRHFDWVQHRDDARVRRKLIRRLGDFFRTLSVSEQESALASVTGQLRPNGAARLPACSMSEEQVRQLSRSELVTIGSHTATHASLGWIEPDRQKNELGESKRALEAITGSPVTSFSYPNGILAAETPAIARELGYAIGCTSREGAVSPVSDRFRLPRLWVGDWDGDRFCKWLRRWMP